ncbi:MAG: ABC transporter permease, partial [Bdellovibrionota bacterium]
MALLHWFSLGLGVLGEFSQFMADTIACIGKFWRRRDLFFRHCQYIGVSSSGIILVSGTFMGAVLGYQLYV